MARRVGVRAADAGATRRAAHARVHGHVRDRATRTRDRAADDDAKVQHRVDAVAVDVGGDLGRVIEPLFIVPPLAEIARSGWRAAELRGSHAHAPALWTDDMLVAAV